MIRPRNQTEDLLLPITEKCETPNKRTHTRPEETLQYKFTKPRDNFSFEPPISIEGCWMRRLTSLEVYNSFLGITEENSKFELYKNTFDEFSFTKLKDEVAKIGSISVFTPKHLQHEIKRPRNIKAYEKLRSEK